MKKSSNFTVKVYVISIVLIAFQIKIASGETGVFAPRTFDKKPPTPKIQRIRPGIIDRESDKPEPESDEPESESTDNVIEEVSEVEKDGSYKHELPEPVPVPTETEPPILISSGTCCDNLIKNVGIGLRHSARIDTYVEHSMSLYDKCVSRDTGGFEGRCDFYDALKKLQQAGELTEEKISILHAATKTTVEIPAPKSSGLSPGARVGLGALAIGVGGGLGWVIAETVDLDSTGSTGSSDSGCPYSDEQRRDRICSSGGAIYRLPCDCPSGTRQYPSSNVSCVGRNGQDMNCVQCVCN